MRLADLVTTLARVERWLLPGVCLLCEGPAGATDDLACPLCRSRWIPVPPPVCSRCGQPLDRAAACRICAGWPDGFGNVRSAVWLDGSARAAVHHLKYGGWRRMARPMGRAMTGLEALDEAAVLVPIPLGHARLRRRGYNQSAALAEALAACVGRPVRDLLARSRETMTQTRLTPEEREANLREAFVAVREPPPGPLVLVDDVFTTGATLASAARALRAHGAPDIRAVTFARARRPLDDDVTVLTTTAREGLKERG